MPRGAVRSKNGEDSEGSRGKGNEAVLRPDIGIQALAPDCSYRNETFCLSLYHTVARSKPRFALIMSNNFVIEQ